MISLQRKERGFTIVELLIVIVVIGILAALVITTFSGIQRKARDTERTTDIKAVHGQIEAYYAQNGRYPTLANLNDGTWVAEQLKGLDEGARVDPKATNNSTTFVGAPAANAYSYAVLGGEDGDEACDNTAIDCSVYTLTATLEGGGTFEKTQLN